MNQQDIDDYGDKLGRTIGGELKAMTARDRAIADAAQTVAHHRRAVTRAEAKLARRRDRLADAEAALAAIEPIQRAQRLLTKVHDIVTTLTEPDDPATIDLDADPRPADAQAADFFQREGDYHRVQIDIPIPYTCEYEEHEHIAAQCVIKFTPDQQPLIVETLRQIRGALGARITLTRLDVASDECAKVDTPQVNDSPPETIFGAQRALDDYNQTRRDTCPHDSLSGDEGPIAELGRYPHRWRCDECGQPHVDVVIDDGPPIPMSEFTLGQRYSELDRQREAIAASQGVPIDWVHPVPSPTGDTAWNITPPPRPAGGRHAAPDHAIELKADEPGPYTTTDIAALHNSIYEHSILQTRTAYLPTDDIRLGRNRVGTTTYWCSCGHQLDGGTEDTAEQLWKQHRAEVGIKSQLQPWQSHMLDQIRQTNPEHIITALPYQHPQRRPLIADEIHDHTYTGDDDQ